MNAITQEQYDWLADQIELTQYRDYGVVIPDVRDVIANIRGGVYVKEDV